MNLETRLAALVQYIVIHLLESLITVNLSDIMFECLDIERGADVHVKDIFQILVTIPGLVVDTHELDDGLLERCARAVCAIASVFDRIQAQIAKTIQLFQRSFATPLPATSARIARDNGPCSANAPYVSVVSSISTSKPSE